MSDHTRITALAIVVLSLACGEHAPPLPEGTAGGTTVTPTPALLAALTEDQVEGRAIYQSVC